MGACKIPNYLTGVQGKNWARSLRAAQEAGAKIVVAETGVPVKWDWSTNKFRPWVDRKGARYDSRDCAPHFP